MINKLLILFLIFSQIAYAKTQTKASYDECGESPKAIELAKLIVQNANQNRTKIVCNKALSHAAAFKARDMAKQNKVSHYANNKSPNELLRIFQIPLPNKYSILGNQVEAVSGGFSAPQVTFDYFLSSEDHKNLILGIGELFKEQDQIGVGYYYDRSKKHEDYWVVYTTALRKNDEELKSSKEFDYTTQLHQRTQQMLKKEKQEKIDLRYSPAKRKKRNDSVKSSYKVSL